MVRAHQKVHPKFTSSHTEIDTPSWNFYHLAVELKHQQCNFFSPPWQLAFFKSSQVLFSLLLRFNKRWARSCSYNLRHQAIGTLFAEYGGLSSDHGFASSRWETWNDFLSLKQDLEIWMALYLQVSLENEIISLFLGALPKFQKSVLHEWYSWNWRNLLKAELRLQKRWSYQNKIAPHSPPSPSFARPRWGEGSVILLRKTLFLL